MIPKNMESNKEPKLVTCQLVSSKFQDKKVSADLQFDTIWLCGFFKFLCSFTCNKNTI